jgi:ribose 5-phosphate isomerase RpiB
MIYTARQLEQLHKANGHVTLPYNARLTPSASDWVRARKLAIEYTDGEAKSGCGCPHKQADQAPSQTTKAGGTFLWWCDGPCGAAKAAILSHARQQSLLPVEVGSDPSETATVVKRVANEVRSGRVAGAILAVNHGAAAMVMANRCASLRAVLGTRLDSLEHAIRGVAANVLVLEHASRTLNEMRNMIGRFTVATRSLPPDVARQLEELASCG